jgi:hypothetical protein
MMRRAIAVIGFVSLLAVAAVPFTVISNGADAAGSEATFLIPASDGYGVADCLMGGTSGCGTIVADAWCEAQGFSRADTFGQAVEDVTGSTEPTAMAVHSARPISITCAN